MAGGLYMPCPLQRTGKSEVKFNILIKRRRK